MNEAITKASVPAVYPALYVTTVDMLSDPMKLAGFSVLLLQGVYLVIQIVRTLKGKRDAKKQVSN